MTPMQQEVRRTKRRKKWSPDGGIGREGLRCNEHQRASTGMHFSIAAAHSQEAQSMILHTGSMASRARMLATGEDVLVLSKLCWTIGCSAGWTTDAGRSAVGENARVRVATTVSMPIPKSSPCVPGGFRKNKRKHSRGSTHTHTHTGADSITRQSQPSWYEHCVYGILECVRHT